MCLMSFLPIKAQQYVLSGVVTDSVTHEPLSFVNVYLKGTQTGTRTNSSGEFILKTSLNSARLVISSVGYKEYVRFISPAKDFRFVVALKPANISLKEIVIKPKREHYKKKDNPAVAFIRQMLAHRDDHSPDNHSYWSRNRYEKVLFAMNNFTEEKQKKGIYRKFPFLLDYVDTSAVTKKPILPVVIRETVASDYYRKDPKSLKQLIEARKHAGIDEILSQQGMEATVGEVFRDVDIYQDNITLFTNKFVSPLSKLGVSFYKYYLLDTLQVDREKCVDLAFVPFNSESFGFTGHFYVTLDSTYFVKKVVLNFPKKINLNFVDYMILNQTFTRPTDGTRELQNEDIIVEFKLSAKSDGIYARRNVVYSGYSFDAPQNMFLFKKSGTVIEAQDALTRDDEFWEASRPKNGGVKTNEVSDMMHKLRSYPLFYWSEKILQVAFTGYVPSSQEKPLFYFGLLNTTVSGNPLEGTRLRFGGMTTACFQKILSTGFGCGYSPIAPGTVGALLMWIVWIMLYAFLPYDIYFTLSSLIFLFFAYFGTKAAGAVEVIWGKDPSKVVVDEMIGVLIPLMTIGSTAIWFYYSIAAFILFRLFDIFKPLGIRSLERWKGGVGIMADDVLSGIYSAIILLIAQWFIG